jgi:hypothetical protein
VRWITHCSHAIVLENLVYYRNDTHYLVMTAKADCLVRAGVCRTVSGKARPDEPLAHRPRPPCCAYPTLWPLRGLHLVGHRPAPLRCATALLLVSTTQQCSACCAVHTAARAHGGGAARPRERRPATGPVVASHAPYALSRRCVRHQRSSAAMSRCAAGAVRALRRDARADPTDVRVRDRRGHAVRPRPLARLLCSALRYALLLRGRAARLPRCGAQLAHVVAHQEKSTRCRTEQRHAVGACMRLCRVQRERCRNLRLLDQAAGDAACGASRRAEARRQ